MSKAKKSHSIKNVLVGEDEVFLIEAWNGVVAVFLLPFGDCAAQPATTLSPDDARTWGRLYLEAADEAEAISARSAVTKSGDKSND